MLFSEAITKFANYKAIKYQRASEIYKACMDQFRVYIKKEIGEIDNDDIIGYQQYMKSIYQDSSQSIHASALRSFFEFSNGRGWTNINLKEIDVPRVVEKIPVYVVQSQFDTLCEVAKDQPLKLLCLRLLWFTGVRVSELCDMKVTDLNTTEKCCKIQARKAFRPKIIFWDDITNELIKKCTTQNQYLFSSPKTCGKLTTRQIERWISELVKQAGINKHITPHSFRHGCTHQLLDMGMDLPAIQDLLGHKHPQSLFKYTKRLDEDIKEKGREAVRKRVAVTQLKELARELHLEELLK